MTTISHPQTTIQESDLKQHVEDDIKVTAIRDGNLTEVFWNELTEDEKRAAYCNMFSIY